MPEEQKTYEDGHLAGLTEGRLLAVEHILSNHAQRLDGVERKLSTLERVAYTLLGAIALVQFAPTLKSFLS